MHDVGGQRGSTAGSGAGPTVAACAGRLAESLGRAGLAQLTAAGCRTEPAADSLGALRSDARLWTSGAARAAALAAGDPDLAELAALPADLAAALGALAVPGELLLLLGSDDRVVPVDGRNSYGLCAIDLDPVVRLSSCTATPPDRVAVAVADAWRRRHVDAMTVTGSAPDPAALHADPAGRLVAMFGLGPEWVERTVLTASGTDTEAVVTAFAAGAGDRPVVNILVGSREAGRGTQLAAQGRSSMSRTPFGIDTQPGSVIDGFAAYDVRLVDVDIRDRSGRPRRAFDVEAEIDAHLDDAIESGARVVVHIIEGSKTGLRQPTLTWLRDRRSRDPETVRFVVDAAQLRTSRSRIVAYLEAGASVMLTGSKGLGGPPFCGALLLEEGLYADACALSSLPTGLSQVVAQADLPPALAGLAPGWQPHNLGLLARWEVALHEWETVIALPSLVADTVRGALIESVRRRLTMLPGIRVLADCDSGRTIVSFVITDDITGAHGIEWTADLYRRIVAERGVQIGQPVQLVAGGMTALRMAVGATTVNRLAAAAQPATAAHAMAADAVDRVAAVLGVRTLD